MQENKKDLQGLEDFLLSEKQLSYQTRVFVEAQFISVGDVLIFGRGTDPVMEKVTDTYKYQSDEVCICTASDVEGSLWYRHTALAVKRNG